MDIGSVSAAATLSVLPKTSQAAVPTGQDNDGDNDHGAPDVKSAVAAGVGTAIDQTA